MIVTLWAAIMAAATIHILATIINTKD